MFLLERLPSTVLEGRGCFSHALQFLCRLVSATNRCRKNNNKFLRATNKSDPDEYALPPVAIPKYPQIRFSVIPSSYLHHLRLNLCLHSSWNCFPQNYFVGKESRHTSGRVDEKISQCFAFDRMNGKAGVRHISWTSEAPLPTVILVNATSRCSRQARVELRLRGCWGYCFCTHICTLSRGDMRHKYREHG